MVSEDTVSRFIPRGVAVASLGKRVLAALLDALPVVILVMSWMLVLNFADSVTANFVSGIVALMVLAAYMLYQWWAYGSRGQGFGANVMGIQLVGINSGQPIGWWRYFLRQAVLLGLMLTVVGGLALLVFTAIHERRQGWHDMAARSLLVEPRSTDEKPARASRQRSGGNSVAMPPHVGSPFAPSTSTEHGTWMPGEPEVTRPAWLPSVPSQPTSQHSPVPQAPSRAVPPAGPQPQRSAGGFVQAGPPRSSTEPPAAQPSRPETPQRPQATPPGIPSASPSRPGGWIPLPTPSSVIEPPKDLPRVRARQFGDQEDDDGTRLAIPGGGVLPDERAGDEGWYVRLDDGRHVQLNVTVLLGRNPQRAPEDPPVHLVPAGGDGRMISRTHVMIGTDARGVFVTDRGSTNGTAVVHSNGQLQPCPVGTRVLVKEGQQVSYGDRWFTVERHPATPGA